MCHVKAHVFHGHMSEEPSGCCAGCTSALTQLDNRSFKTQFPTNRPVSQRRLPININPCSSASHFSPRSSVIRPIHLDRHCDRAQPYARTVDRDHHPPPHMHKLPSTTLHRPRTIPRHRIGCRPLQTRVSRPAPPTTFNARLPTPLSLERPASSVRSPFFMLRTGGAATVCTCH